jgi:hypothetical protein
MRHLLTTAALAVTAGLGLFSVGSAAKAQCNSFNAGIGSCVNHGYGRSSTSNNSSFTRYRNDNRSLLMEQPRFQPNFGSGTYGNTYRTNSW